jgi:hypothetical protein
MWTRSSRLLAQPDRSPAALAGRPRGAGQLGSLGLPECAPVHFRNVTESNHGGYQ